MLLVLVAVTACVPATTYYGQKGKQQMAIDLYACQKENPVANESDIDELMHKDILVRQCMAARGYFNSKDDEAAIDNLKRQGVEIRR
jgi:predicted aminopeptidase